MENAEKVVNEPKSPIIKKYFIKIVLKPLSNKFETKTPIKKDPIKLTTIVLMGKKGL